MALRQIAVGVWVETDAIGAITSKVEAKHQERHQETKVISRTGAEMYIHRTKAPMVDMNAVRAANRTHEIILRELGIKDDPRFNPDQVDS